MSDVLVFDGTPESGAINEDSRADVLVFDAPQALVVVEAEGDDTFLLFDASATTGNDVVALPRDFVLFDAATPAVTVVSDTGGDVLVLTSGSRGPKGDPGENGLSGSAGGSFTFNQMASSDTWEIIHPLEYVPNVMIVDSAGTVLTGEIEYVSPSHLRFRSSVPTSGTAYLS